MMLFRFCNEEYSNDISGEGAKLRGGRWNSVGLPVVYTSTTISLSLLELLIYNASYDELQNNYLMKIEIPDMTEDSIAPIKLKKQWQKDIGYSRFIGDSFLSTKKNIFLQVPSAIIPEENNVLINPLHPDFKKIKIINSSPFEFDNRLFK